ncbi:MAG: hypothetical protein ACSLFN_11940 [Candidatus Limnocylindrales bacterium]
MPAPEGLVGQRVVADPEAIDAIVAALPAGVTSLRFAPDEVFVIGHVRVDVGEDAIVEAETGFVAITMERAVVERHTEWPLPLTGVVAQGAIAGIPAKLAWLPDGRAWIVTYAAYADELLDRLR